MKLGLHVNTFTWPGGDAEIGRTLARVAAEAEDAGFQRISVMDHVWQISMNGQEDEPMLEAYTTLGFLAHGTTRLELLAMVTAATYRAPGLLAKAVTTLDVLSGGRAWLGIGAGWNGEEATGLGLSYGGTSERFQRLEEVLQICLQMWGPDRSPYLGRHYALASTLNSPGPVSKPRPRIMIGGAGEQRTLRLVAKYADACNIFGGPDAARKLAVLREHCEREERDYASIEKTAIAPLGLADGGTEGLLKRLRVLHEMGFEAVHGHVGGVATTDALQRIGAEVITEIESW